MVNSINSNNIIPIEQHFRISAGPGAGKTYWLINHIKHILNISSRLHISRKIACITYTNIAAETILTRLGQCSDRVEVSTIHSFLYRNIIKPYIHLIANEYSLNVHKVEGHDEVFISRSKITSWISNHPNVKRLSHPFTARQLGLNDNLNALKNWLSTLFFKFNSNNELQISSDRRSAYFDTQHGRRYLNNRCLELLEIDLLSFKKEYWKEGILHHDDVLFFSYLLLERYPFILTVLQAKFPYFFIDEFQDSNPIQIQIVKKIGQNETKIGIIGDKAQSIYGFQGADPNLFEAFSLDGIIDYKMLDNRRSTNQIIDCLNIIRPDFLQNKFNNINSDLPCILVGDMKSTYAKVRDFESSDFVHTLSYKNIISNVMKKEIDISIPLNNLLHSLSKIDSNKDRQSLILACIKATELALLNRFKDALKELAKQFKEYENLAKKEALKHLILLINKHKEYRDGSLRDYHDFINKHVKHIAGLRRGRILEFYENHTYQQLAVCVNVIEDNSLHKTIHKSKGDEFDNVVLILENEQDLNFLFAPNLNENEDHRVFYVAISRAKKRLFISVPTLSDENKSKINLLLFNLVELSQ